MKKTALIFSAVFFVVFLAAHSHSGQNDSSEGFWSAHSRVGQVDRSRGQILYVPTAYLDLSSGDWPDKVYQYAFTRLIIRNLDPFLPITLNSVMFHDQNGQERFDLLGGVPVTIGAFKSITLSISLRTLLPHGIMIGDQDGGRSFVLVDWDAEKKVITPNISSSVAFIRFSGNPLEYPPPPIPVTYTYEALTVMAGAVLEEK
jgi:hypothetical protein